jgi:molybdenum cofactor cytidylyltransferase
MSQAPKLAAIVLAAGSSTRMGQTKQLLRLNESTLLASVLQTIRAAQIPEIVIVLGHNADEIRRSLDAQTARIVLNPNHAAGLSSSLQAGLAALAPATDAAFIALADQPYVRAETYTAVGDAYTRTRAPIVIPTHNGKRGNPVLLARSIFPELMKLEGDVGARAVFAHHAGEILKVPVDDPGILIDFDTPEDLATHGISSPRPPRTDK